jgi:hypothetical protein
MKKKTKLREVSPVNDIFKKWHKTLGWEKPCVKAMTINYPKIELANTTKTNNLEPYINKVVAALGHPEALVTDESYVWDMLNVFGDKEDMQKQLDKAHKKLGVIIMSNELITTVAKRLKGKNKNDAKR